MAPRRDLSGRAVEVEQRLVDQPLIVGVEPDDGGRDLVEHGLDGLLDALAAVAVAAVAEFDGLVLTGRGAGGHRGPGEGAVVERHLDLDRRVAPGVEDLARSDLLDDGHWRLLAWCWLAGRIWCNGHQPRGVRL